MDDLFDRTDHANISHKDDGDFQYLLQIRKFTISTKIINRHNKRCALSHYLRIFSSHYLQTLSCSRSMSSPNMVDGGCVISYVIGTQMKVRILIQTDTTRWIIMSIPMKIRSWLGLWAECGFSCSPTPKFHQ